jgi:Ras-related protein Rab-5C
MQIETARGRATAEEYGIGFWETSAKDGTNVSKAFNAIAKDIVERMLLGPPAVPHEAPAAPSDPASHAAGKRCSLM